MLDLQNITNRLREKRILVTGASGFIGEHLCNRLISFGTDLHAVSRYELTGRTKVKWWQCALDDSAEVNRLIDQVRPEIIFHLASYVSGRRGMENVLPMIHGNLLSVINLMNAAVRFNCERVILTGSLEEPEGRAESAVPVSPYAAAKWASSCYSRMYHALYQAPVVTARLFMVYGGGQKDHTKLVPYVILQLLKKQVPQLMSGSREVDWVYVDDVVDSYLALSTATGIEGETFDIGTGKLTSVKDVVMRLSTIVGSDVEPSFGSVSDRPLERVRRADVVHTEKCLGWAPHTPLNTGLELTVDWYRTNIINR
jgi:nucleoside-diphosphate-sugar epimerase